MHLRGLLGLAALAFGSGLAATATFHRAPSLEASPTPFTSTTSTRGDAASVQAGADQSWLTEASRAIAAEEYRAAVSTAGLQAPNRAHDFRTYFDDAGITVVPRQGARRETAAWRFAWRLAGWGRRGAINSVKPVAPVIEGARVTYVRPGLREWYENTAKGLEQGFEVSEPPRGEGPLCIEGKVNEELHAELDPHSGAVDFFDKHGARVVRYADLVVCDTTGREIPSRLALAGNALTIEIEDAGASYPILVDPLMTSPAWTAESNQIGAQFGISVATAGDVNGDGFSDVIVGASFYDNGEDREGRAFLFHGSPAGLASTPAWMAESNQIFAQFGASVAAAGDVNGDGYSDVIVGAYVFDNGEFHEGRAFVYHGSATGLAALPVWTAESNQFGAHLGSVATAGDVNGDGFSDVIVGAFAYDNGETDEGRAFVYHGSGMGLAPTPAWTAESNQAHAQFGVSVATAGDVNGDGYSDVIVGAFEFDNGQTDEGRAFVYHGSAAGLGTTAVWTAESNQTNAWFGSSVAPAGDVNGDGFSDVIVGDIVGQAFAYQGSTGGLISTAAWSAQSNQPADDFGTSVATAGDVNGDGFSDVIVGARVYDNGEENEGRVFVYHGSTAGLATVPGWIAEPNQAFANFGDAVATAGDVNGDGYSDVIVGARYFDNGEAEEGRAFVYHGAAAGLATTAGWTAESDQPVSFLGWLGGAATAGDVNGDGYSDVIVSARYFDNGLENRGRAFVYHGSSGGLPITPNWTAESNQANAFFGSSVAYAGDVNGDGYPDIIVGAEGISNGHAGEGRVFVYFGRPSGLTVLPVWSAEGNQANAFFGNSVATAGDVNGDGFADVIVGAREYDNGQTNEGRAFAYHGSASGLATSPAWTAESDQANSDFAFSVASAGDVNGDGFSDVIIGADQFDNAQDSEGRVFVYHGSASGLSTAPSWTAETNQAGASFFALQAATAGDVNGDGFSDVIVGAGHYNNGQGDEGAAFVYHGSASGLSNAPNWTGDSNQIGAHFGFSVATAGDVNGDRFSDVVISAIDYDNGQGQVNEGRAFVYHGSAAGLAASPAWIAEGNLNGCGFGSAVATAGDVNGDGFSDVIVGAHGYDNGQPDEGRVFVYYGNEGDGLDRIARQRRVDDTAPIDLIGLSDSQSSFRLKARGRTPAGRGKVRLQVEVKPLGTPFDGLGLIDGLATDTGAPGANGSAVTLSQLAGGLSQNTLYHWRVRVRSNSPFFPRSPWLTLPGNAASEADVRTAAGSNAVAEQQSPQHLWIESNTPNPFTTSTQITYSLPQRGPLRLAVYDVLGREVARLADGIEEAGRHTTRWDRRDSRAQELPAGVYFLRLEFAGSSIGSRKIVIAQ